MPRRRIAALLGLFVFGLTAWWIFQLYDHPQGYGVFAILIVPIAGMTAVIALLNFVVLNTNPYGVQDGIVVAKSTKVTAIMFKQPTDPVAWMVRLKRADGKEGEVNVTEDRYQRAQEGQYFDARV